MDKILTYKQITDAIKEIAQNHLQVKNVYISKPFQVEDGNKEFPILFVELIDVSLNKTQGSQFQFKDYALKLSIYDLINKELDNEVDLFSDLIQIMSDVLNILSDYKPIIDKIATISNSPLLIPTYQLLDSNANGIETTIIIRTVNGISYCQAPVNLNNVKI